MALPLSRLPWLMLTDNPNSSKRTFFGIIDHTSYEVELEEVEGTSCVGSSEGWLILVRRNLDMCLFNPFSRVQIQLPPQPTLESQYHDREGRELTMEERRDDYIRKAILSCSLSSSSSSSLANDCVVVLAIHGVYRNLAFSKLGFTSWKTIPSMLRPFEDAAFYQGKFCVLSDRGVLAVVWDFNAEQVRLKEIISGPRNWYNRKKYLLSAYDNLFVVARRRIIKNDHFFTTGFKAYILITVTDNGRGGDGDVKAEFQWKKVTDLRNLAMFVGGNSSMCFSADEYPGCKKNCIYFTDDHRTIYGGDSDMGVCNCGDGTIERPYPGMTQPNVWPPFWVIPN